MSGRHDTIAALATPQGTSAIAVLRASGPDTGRIAMALTGVAPLPRRARRVDYRTLSGELIDSVLATWFKGPQSYTGEDTLEISCHGNPFIAQKILEDLLARGCRSAEPGEFTQRAFLNGKLDLTQAEAVMDLIHASSDRALAAANEQLRGGLAKRVEALIDTLHDALARIEAYIDFPEEDLPPEDRQVVVDYINQVINDINNLKGTERYRSAINDGFKVVIAGSPNVGKSSLLNRIVGRDRALVSEEPGTTRDFIEERIIIDGHLVRIFDTAGIRDTTSALEALGIQKARALAENADIVMHVVDASNRTLRGQDEVWVCLGPERTILVENKIDCAPIGDALRPLPSPAVAVVETSAISGQGIDLLLAQVGKMIRALGSEVRDHITVNSRHARHLVAASQALGSAVAGLDNVRCAIELAASDLRSALGELGSICGDVDNERMLDRLFSTFCIGK